MMLRTLHLTPYRSASILPKWRAGHLALLVVALSGVTATGCKKKAEAQSKPDEVVTESKAPSVHFAKVEQRSLPPTLEFTGTLEAEQASDVATQAAGVVRRVVVDVGARVKKGDPLIELDARDAQLKVTSAQATAEQIIARLGLQSGQRFDPTQVADVRAAKEALDLSLLDAERSKSLVASGAVSQAAFDTAKSNADRTRAQYESAVAAARQSWASYQAAQAQVGIAAKQLADMVIRAPFDGAVADRSVEVGEYANAGKVVAVVVNDNPLRLRLDIPEGDLPRIVIGNNVSVSVAAYPGRVFLGVVERIGASARAQSRTIPVEAKVQNDSGELRPGFFARAQVGLKGENETVLLVPQNAVGTSGSSARVFIRVGDRVVERLVTPGRHIDDLVVINGGNLTDKDEVAVDNVSNLSDGAEVALAK